MPRADGPHPLRRTALGLAVLAAVAMPFAVAQAPPSPDSVAARARSEITLDAASSEVDYRSNTLLFRDVTITQGSTRAAAERARSSGLDFEEATWTLSGRVRIDVEGGALRSEEATVSFLDNRIVRATVRGAPAEFEQRLKDGQLARGRASDILYDLEAGTVTLRGEAWLSDGGNEIRGQQLVYQLREQRVQAGRSSGADERVRITIRPRDRSAEKRP